MDSRAYIMLIHYYSNPRKDINKLLLKNVKSGNIPAYQYGAINDFMAKWGKGKYGNKQYYDVWHTDPDIENTPNIEIKRNQIGLHPLETQSKIKGINLSRRKSGSANNEILLE